MSDDLVDYDPQDYPEAVAWFNECKARRKRDRESRIILEKVNKNLNANVLSLSSRNAELEATIKRHNDGAMQMIAEQAARIRELEAECDVWKSKAETRGRDGASARAELAALKARSCETCRYYVLCPRGLFDATDYKHEWHVQQERIHELEARIAQLDYRIDGMIDDHDVTRAELAALQTEHNAVAAKYKQKWQQAEAERDDEKASRELWWEKCQQAEAEVARLNLLCDRLAAAGHS